MTATGTIFFISFLVNSKLSQIHWSPAITNSQPNRMKTTLGQRGGPPAPHCRSHWILELTKTPLRETLRPCPCRAPLDPFGRFWVNGHWSANPMPRGLRNLFCQWRLFRTTDDRWASIGVELLYRLAGIFLCSDLSFFGFFFLKKGVTLF